MAMIYSSLYSLLAIVRAQAKSIGRDPLAGHGRLR
jgi:hypothetical protein